MVILNAKNSTTTSMKIDPTLSTYKTHSSSTYHTSSSKSITTTIKSSSHRPSSSSTYYANKSHAQSVVSESVRYIVSTTTIYIHSGNCSATVTEPPITLHPSHGEGERASLIVAAGILPGVIGLFILCLVIPRVCGHFQARRNKKDGMYRELPIVGT